MSTRLYKINGEYNTFEYWHDHYGYTKTPTFSVQYKTTNPWGAAFASDGYYDAEDLMDIFTFSFFVPGVVGWYSIDDLALVGYYPAAATELTVYREGVASNAASLAGDDGTYYLVERDINQGWMTEEELFARGWEFITIDYTYLLIDETTGNSVLENFEQDFAVEPIAESIIPDDDFVVTPLTEFPVTTFYLNSEGNKATTDHYLTMTGNPVFDLDGNNILYNDYKDIQGVMPAYFSRVDNTFFMGQSGDTFVDWSEGKAGIGAVASRGKDAWSVSFERRDGVIDIYVKTNSTYPTQFMYQRNVTSVSTAAPNAESLNEIYLDSAFTQRLQIDPNMDYELGSMVNQEWTPNAVQTKEDMPSSTTSSTSTKVSAELLTESNGNFLMWFVTNYTSTSSISAPSGYIVRKLRVTPKPAPLTPFIELDLGLWYHNNAWGKYKPPASDTAYSGLLSQEDADAVTAFGLTITTGSTGAGPIGGIVANSPSNNNRHRFEYELLALYSDIVNNHGSGSQTFDPTNFTVVRNIESSRPTGIILLKNQLAYQTLVSAWRLRVTKYDAQYIDVLLGLRWSSTQWRTVDFNYSSGNYWYGGIMSAEDQQRLIDFGCTIQDQGSGEVGTYGAITYQNRDFAYEVIGIYSDVNGTTSAQYDLSTLYLQSYNSRFTIWCSVQNSSSAITWKCRIYKLT